MSTDYKTIKISIQRAEEISRDLFGIEGESTPLPGELDFNFRIKNSNNSFILKISRPNADEAYIDYQQTILDHVANHDKVESPRIIKNKEGQALTRIKDENDNIRLVRMLTWTEGRLWSNVNPIGSSLLKSLGKQAGMLTELLKDYDHKHAHRVFEWDIAQTLWTKDYYHLFNHEQLELAEYFINLFEGIQPEYAQLRKSVVHNDVNDNNILVTNNLIEPKVKSIIDYGDAIYTQTINDLAVTLAYAMMDFPSPLDAAIQLIEGYHSSYEIKEEELSHLYTLVSMQLLITVTKSAINKQKEPDNEYLLISEKPAWELLKKWRQIDKEFAHASFRSACNLPAHKNEQLFRSWASQQSFEFSDLFPTLSLTNSKAPDMSVSSTWLGHEFEYEDLELTQLKVKRLSAENPTKIIAGGYGEVRPFYSTEAYKIEGNNGPEYRTVHLGTDFWLKEGTPVHTIEEATVYSVHNNNFHKDYGPTVILEHKTDEGTPFWTLYGHLTTESLTQVKTGQKLKKGDLIGFIGEPHENGNWVPHLHFQLMLDMLGNSKNFPGVATPSSFKVWKSISPDPNILFNCPGLNPATQITQEEILSYRRNHLGRSLSVSYEAPLTMVRGAGAHLIDATGRKYLDTVNNVAHVGHEHPRVVKAAKDQIGLLNTNTRYLHENINSFAEELLQTFPNELSVVHFVNSGSEANELALRMAKAVTGAKDVIAVEVGYHGNTNGCIDISSYKFDGKGGSGAPEHTHIVPLPDCYRGIHRGEETGEAYASYIQKSVEDINKKGRNVSAFICESIISCGGQIELPKNYLNTAYNTVRKAGGVCISDEVQVGCGRVGKEYWGFQLHDVIPDIVTIGKPIGNGHPLAAVACTERVATAFANGMEYFNTFGGNPVSSAIGKEVLTVVREEGLRENALFVGDYLKQALRDLSKDHPIIGDIRGQGLFIGFELVNSQKDPLPEKASYLANRMKELGILMSTDGKDNNVLKIKPPMVFSKENADELTQRINQILNEDFMQL